MLPSPLFNSQNGAIGSLIGTTDAFPGYTCRLEIVGTEGSVILEDGEIKAWNLKAEIGEVGAYGRSKEAKRADAARMARAAVRARPIRRRSRGAGMPSRCAI